MGAPKPGRGDLLLTSPATHLIPQKIRGDQQLKAVYKQPSPGYTQETQGRWAGTGPPLGGSPFQGPSAGEIWSKDGYFTDREGTEREGEKSQFTDLCRDSAPS
jgi:hypothetical protein